MTCPDFGVGVSDHQHIWETSKRQLVGQGWCIVSHPWIAVFMPSLSEIAVFVVELDRHVPDSLEEPDCRNDST